jgi:hypothetical protein
MNKPGDHISAADILTLKTAVDDRLTDLGVALLLYNATEPIQSGDKSAYKPLYVYQNTFTGYVEFPKNQRDVAANIGVFGTLTGMLRLERSAFGVVQDRSVVVDPDGNRFVVQGPPTVAQGAKILCVICSVIQIYTRPNGVS